ncbi:hypothetical protein [Photorhabdus tasmaniensis]|uniref:Uncharacterized protein n=1 Tax=Photorhabdus tasmaniensis TaxID=1004159 RepID=A0ABX0GM50_9GAMM|nr:hypothetical protein [Photorhabdus tasmaniensis]NHB90318.1 hypothetical protein [Photorhabdus tasmaniensis]
MKKDIWKNIQPLRIPSRWVIDVNNFYDYEPTKENMDWFYGSILISGHNSLDGLCFDSRYEPEGDPNGLFVLDFFIIKTNKKTGKTEEEKFLGSKQTRDKSKFINILEEFMFTGKYE